MDYAILRTKKLKSGQAVRRSLAHALRTQDTPNADPDRTPDNTTSVETIEAGLDRLNDRLATQGKVRSNAVLAIEYLMTASPEVMAMKSREEQDAYFNDALVWLKSRHGDENVVAWGIHRDETTPHMYAIVVPLDDKGKLNCRHFLGGAKALNLMQTEFAQEVGQRHGLRRGIAGSKARHTTVREYYARANAPFEPLPEVTTPNPTPLPPEPEAPGLFAGREAKEEYETAKAVWEQQRQANEVQATRRQSEERARYRAAVDVARTHEVQAREAQAMKRRADELKESNGGYMRKLVELEAEAVALRGIADLFTPEEVEARSIAKKQADAVRVKTAQQEAAKAAESTRLTQMMEEVVRRVESLHGLLKRAGGAAYTFAKHALQALEKHDNKSERVDWKWVESGAVIEAIGEHGQPPADVIEAILEHSPARVDPATHDELRRSVERAAPRLQAKYQERLDRSEPDNVPAP